jgi:hypothetical protein
MIACGAIEIDCNCFSTTPKKQGVKDRGKRSREIWHYPSLATAILALLLLFQANLSYNCLLFPFPFPQLLTACSMPAS